MTAVSKLVVCAGLCGWLGLPGGARAEDAEQPAPREPTNGPEHEAEPEPAQEVVIYKPPPRGSPRGLRPGGTRGGTALPRPLALAPDHVAHTLRASPSLFWHIDGEPPESASLVLTLIEAAAIEPILEVELPHPASAGIQRIRLSDYAVTLATQVEYEWAVALQPEAQPGPDDRVSQGYLRRVSADALAGRPESASAFAEMGLWYDALETLSDAIDAGAGPDARRQRDSLLRQAHLKAALK